MGERDDHDHGLAGDLVLIRRQLIARRRALTLLGSAALGGVAAGLWPPRPARADDICVVDAPEEPGPFPADGTNTFGSIHDVLRKSGVVREDLRHSFLKTTTAARGVRVKFELTLVDTNRGCRPLPDFAVYLWHCTRDGQYSLYTEPDESYLRGVQVADARGRVRFVTIFPGCYAGRWPHIHLEHFRNLAHATGGRRSVLTTQLAMPAEICRTVYDNVRGYRSSRELFATVSIPKDIVFRDNTPWQMAAMTPHFTGNADDGYLATATVGIAL